MKTGFTNAFVRKPLNKYYSYHGMTMPCNIQPDPDSFKDFPLEWAGWNLECNYCYDWNNLYYQNNVFHEDGLVAYSERYINGSQIGSGSYAKKQLENPPEGKSYHIDSVKIYSSGFDFDNEPEGFWIRLNIRTMPFLGDLFSPEYYTKGSHEFWWNINPLTGNPWTVDEVNRLRPGIEIFVPNFNTWRRAWVDYLTLRVYGSIY